jgi:hypothetical protein
MGSLGFKQGAGASLSRRQARWMPYQERLIRRYEGEAKFWQIDRSRRRAPVFVRWLKTHTSVVRGGWRLTDVRRPAFTGGRLEGICLT